MKVAIHVLVVAALVAAHPTARPQQPVQPVDVERLGPQVGEIAPDFSAADQFGRTQTLKSIMGPDGAMLVFNRSADW